MIGKKYRIQFDRQKESPFNTKLHSFIRENKLKAIVHPLQIENENTVIILIIANAETHNKIKSAGFVEA